MFGISKDARGNIMIAKQNNLSVEDQISNEIDKEIKINDEKLVKFLGKNKVSE